MYVDEVASSSDHPRHELSKSYHDISINHGLSSKKEMSQSYRELPKPSRLFGWTDEFDLHGYSGLRHSERSDGVHRSKSFACQDQRSLGFSGTADHDTEDDNSYQLMASSHRRQRHKTKSYKDTKVSHFTDDVDPIEPPQEFAGLDTHIQKKYNAAKHCLKKHPRPNDNAVYEFERKIPMQSSILEAQKFKTVIFVSGN